MLPNMYGTKEMRIVRLVIQETGTYNQQFSRPYQTQLDMNSKQFILDTVDKRKNITPAALSGVANSFISPSATPEAALSIVNGWDTRRLRFMMEIQTTDRTGMMMTTEYVVGYTDLVGLSLSNYIDPNMLFIVNGVNITRTQIHNTPLGRQVHHNLIDASHILINDQYQDLSSSNQLFSLRPEDVYDQIDSRELTSQLTDGFVMDGRTKITSNATKSKRSNAQAPVYMANVLDSYLQTARAQRNDSSGQILATARVAVESDPIATDPFMAFIRAINHQSGSNSFTFGDLQRLDPNVVNVTHIAPVTDQSRGTLHQAGQTQNWGGSDGETVFATTLAQATPGYMVQFGISKIHLIATNHDLGGNITTQIADMRTFTTGVDMSKEVQAFIFRFEQELLKNLSFNNQMSFMLDMRCDLLGETWINLSLNGQPSVPYVTPSFCDALMAPVMTRNYNVLDGVASDFDSLMTEIYENDSSYAAGGGIRTGLI